MNRIADMILQPLSSAVASALQPVAPTASPMAYTAKEGGSLSVQGGSVTLVSFQRGGVSLVLGLTGGLIPMAAGDKVTLTYLTPPTITFIPR